MGEQLCQIFLDSQWNAFYSGEVVTGHVKINLRKEKKIRGIEIKFLGEANTSWGQSVSYRDKDGKTQTRTEWFSGHEIYLHNKQHLLGGRGGDLTLLPGEYTYQFSCVIPPTAPCSFEGTHGHVRYTAKVTLDRPWKFNQGAKIAFTVLSPLDLNHNQLLRHPVNLELQKSFCCLFCKSGPLSVTVYIPSTGYVPGQNVPVAVDIDNASNVDIQRVRISLRQICSFKASSPRHGLKKTSHSISEASVGRIAERNCKQETVNLTIPPIPPSYLTNCTLIDLDYVLMVEVCAAGFHVNLDRCVPVVIGTVPLLMTELPNALAQPNPPSAPFAEPAASAPLPYYMDPSIAPPSYQEAMQSANIADHTDTEHIHISTVPFAPRYQTFPMLPPMAQPIDSKPNAT